MDLMDLSKRYLLNKVEHSILNQIILEIQNGNSKINVRDIAQQSYVSTTTVIKLSKKLGYQGYSEMIFSLRDHLAHRSQPASGIDLNSILTESDFQGVNSFVQNLYNFRQNKVFVAGLDFSNIAASYLVRRLATMNVFVYSGDPIDMIVGKDSPALALFLSKSGESKDIIEMVHHSRPFLHKVYGITANPNSTLTKLVDHCFIIKTEGNGNLYDIPDFFVGRTIILFEIILSQFLTLLMNESKT